MYIYSLYQNEITGHGSQDLNPRSSARPRVTDRGSPIDGWGEGLSRYNTESLTVDHSWKKSLEIPKG